MPCRFCRQPVLVRHSVSERDELWHLIYGTGSETNVSLAGDLLDQSDDVMIEVAYSLPCVLSTHCLLCPDSGGRAEVVPWLSTCGVGLSWFEPCCTRLPISSQG